MNNLNYENILHMILEKRENISEEMLDTLNMICSDEICVDPELLNKIVSGFYMHPYEEQIWENILSVISPASLSDGTIKYLIEHNIGIISLCHMQLSDYWLKELIPYDEAPLINLAKRYYLSDKYSTMDFSKFYLKYLSHNSHVSIYLLDLYNYTPKRGLLIYLCHTDVNFEYKEKLNLYIVADQARSITESAEIIDIYERYKNNGIILLSLAENPFTPSYIILEMTKIKGVSYASKIRATSRNTMLVQNLNK